MTTKEITVYEKNEKTYCENCKPQGGKRETLVISLPDHVFCSGCGLDFCERAEPVLLSQDIEINGASYHIVGRTQDELAAEARRMEEEYRVTLPAQAYTERIMSSDEWFLESTVALKKEAIYYGIPKYGHKNCYRKAGGFFLVDQVDRTEPDIEKKHCSACGKPLIR